MAPASVASSSGLAGAVPAAAQGPAGTVVACTSTTIPARACAVATVATHACTIAAGNVAAARTSRAGAIAATASQAAMTGLPLPARTAPKERASVGARTPAGMHVAVLVHRPRHMCVYACSNADMWSHSVDVRTQRPYRTQAKPSGWLVGKLIGCQGIRCMLLLPPHSRKVHGIVRACVCGVEERWRSGGVIASKDPPLPPPLLAPSKPSLPAFQAAFSAPACAPTEYDGAP
eukprot:363193-Chlamydomonas_euryale.AAC.9